MTAVRRIAPGIALLFVVIAGAGAVHLVPDAGAFDPFRRIGALSGPAAILAFVAVQVVIAAFGFLPASFAAVAAGAAFGLARGFLVSALGLFVGGWIAFVLARSLLRPLITRIVARHPAFARLEAGVGLGDWKTVCLLRMSPVMPFALTSYGLGLTRVGHRSFLVGMLASLPSLVCYVAVGALGKAGLDVGTSRLGLLHGVVLAAGVLSMALLALRFGTWLRAALMPPTGTAAAS